MKKYSRKSGFSLIELLTVIGIIAILAAIIFPVMSSVRERARQTNCMTNLQQISNALSMFKMDNHKYPGALVPYITGQPFSAAKSDGGLYGEYVKGGAKVFLCPSSSFDDENAPADQDVGGTPQRVYTYSSYDGYVYAGTYEQHYCYDWWPTSNLSKMDSRVPSNGGTAPQDYMRQLKFRNPPDDTVVTWCSFHESRSGGLYKGKAIVLFLSGRCAQMQASVVEISRWRTKPQ
ncbi:MAG: prepilin-type N-terminal cleavage/methylation domain-containing protein [Armatimonadetes bacterium]|nr:prepilin-type N-terminal cleavage/methylation domain-containing protein [Armatimonadota bacterium]